MPHTSYSVSKLYSPRHWPKQQFPSSPNMANEYAPLLDAIPELTPDNGSASSAYSQHSLDNHWDSRWEEQVAAWEANNEPYIPRHINFLCDCDGSDDEDYSPSPMVGPSQAIQSAAERPLRRWYGRPVNRRAPQSTAPARPSRGSGFGLPPARGYWDSPHLRGIPESQRVNCQSEEDEGQNSGPEEQRAGMGTSHLPPALIHAAPPLDIGPPMVSLPEAPSYVTPPHGTTSLLSDGQVPSIRYEAVSAPVDGSISGRATGRPESAGNGPTRDAAARPRRLWRGLLRAARNLRRRGPREKRTSASLLFRHCHKS